jgi:hypothetical protein
LQLKTPKTRLDASNHRQEIAMAGLRKRELSDFRGPASEFRKSAALTTEDLSMCGLDARLREICHELRTSLDSTPSGVRALARASAFMPSPGQPVYSHTLSEDGDHQLTLLGLHESRRIPMHDHPDMTGLLLVIHGRVHSQQCGFSKHSRETALVELTPGVDRVLEENDFAIVSSQTGSLHSLHALDGNAVCLSLHIFCGPRKRRQSWYFPAAPHGMDRNSKLWHRLDNKRFPHGI